MICRKIIEILTVEKVTMVIGLAIAIKTCCIAKQTLEQAKNVAENFTSRDAKIKIFKRVFNYLRNNRRDFMEGILKDFYKYMADSNLTDEETKEAYRQLTDKNPCHLIHKSNWIDCKQCKSGLNDLFFKLDDVKVNYAGKRKKEHDYGGILEILPDKLSFAKNVKKYADKPLWDNDAWALKDLILPNEDNGSNNPRMEVIEGKYFDFYNTCEFLVYETAYFLSEKEIENKKSDESANSYKDLEKRIKISRNIFDSNSRFPAIGICAITILKNVLTCNEGKEERKSFFILHKRTGAVAESIGMNGVIPSGSYQPIKINESKEWNEQNEQSEMPNLTETVHREFLEEILGFSEQHDLQAKKLIENTGIEEFVDEIYFLGTGYEPLSTKTEVLAAIIIDMADDRKNTSKWLTDKLKSQMKKKDKGKAKKLIEEYEKDKENKIDNEFLETSIGICRNDEGTIDFIELTEINLRQYEKEANSVPAMKEILRIINKPENHKFFGIES